MNIIFSNYKCPFCGGHLSNLRFNKIYHCYSCHFEFSKEEIEVKYEK